ncbi:MAG: lysine exporter LysO family protein [Desulfurococcales archaeon]|nr:lysine exporter LysO family protein [Desulfurococcales archaeon]
MARIPFSVYTVLALAAGLASGYSGFEVPYAGFMDGALYVLVVAAGFLIGAELAGLGGGSSKALVAGGLLSMSTIASGLLSGYIVAGLLGVNLRVGAVIGGGSGWYSLVGPLVSQVDPLMGLVGFLANLTREIVHIILYPLLARCCWFPAIAVGGATTMDTGLPVVTLYGGRRAGLIAMVHGGLITLFAPVVLQFVLFY